ncbi:GNAT family N-acetyltransferase [Bacillus sp. 31A1R]|uniref:GNAT family N-acetyltransferase n=1 Tax=Robertmurraya mangrovi TaxID=3098077 RepID=A0ABU5ITQ5_9BACI|nr:GNAT family N-acetyltransferase [Bacillus sp. 31A1R]MDZ5470503.1 GNAT family N-acetyltransferase [Bacillus sp. 31A1R]
MQYTKVEQVEKSKLLHFFTEHWGSPKMVISSGVYECDSLPGYVCLSDKQEVIGLVTFVDRGNEREIISLDSILENKGIGSNLMELAETDAKQANMDKITLITSNDNINAIKFYQKRGYRIVQVLCDAIDEARKIKPSIPLIGYHGIPIKDELVLEKMI